ncbi:hypothetical protein QYZ87_07945 [Porphyromonadaceae bacterium W3.11]|nr:hypothetical protein [Porphyromonadaceae bacterium W3.11]
MERKANTQEGNAELITSFNTYKEVVIYKIKEVIQDTEEYLRAHRMYEYSDGKEEEDATKHPPQ